MGQDFDPSISRHIQLQEDDARKRLDFLATSQAIENIPIKTKYPHEQRKLIKSATWEKTIEEEGYGNLTFRVPIAKDLQNIRVNIRYPNDEAPPVDITLQQLIGMPLADMAFNNSFVSVSTNIKGGIKIKFQRGFPLPKGSEIRVSATGDSKTEIFWQYDSSQIGNMRFGVQSQVLAVSESEDGKQIFRPTPEDFIVSQMMLYLDDPTIDIDLYNKFGIDPWNDARLIFHRGYLEGNIYLLTPDDFALPLFTGIEDVVGAFYDTGSVRPNSTIGNKQKCFFYGEGQYLYYFDLKNNLERVDYYRKKNMFAVIWNDTFIKLQKGDRIMVLPGVGKFETARSTLTLFGFYNATKT